MKKFLEAVEKLAEECVVKVLEVSRNDDYKIIYIDKREQKSKSPFLKDWVEEHINNHLIPVDYAEGFKHFINSEYAFKTFKYRKYIHYKMKRKMSPYEDWVESVITLIPKNENTFYLIVYNIE